MSLALGPKKPSTTILTRPNFSEPIDRQLCQRMVDTGVLRKYWDDKWGCTEEELVLRIKKKVKNGVLPVKYQRPKTGYGRVNPKDSLSLGSLRKAVRHTLCGDSWVDFDVENCHPAILLQLCEETISPALRWPITSTTARHASPRSPHCSKNPLVASTNATPQKSYSSG